MTTAGATAPQLTVHPHRLLPAVPGVREIAVGLSESVGELLIIFPHGHQNPAALLRGDRFADPTSLRIRPDHGCRAMTGW